MAKKLLAIILVCVLAICTFPMSITTLAEETGDKLQLTTLDGFTSGTEKYKVTQGAVLSVIDKTDIIGSHKALEVNADALGTWSKAAVDIPLNVAVGDSNGILVYVEWVDNTNFFINLSGIANGADASWTFNQWNANIPLYDVAQDKWIGSNESNNAGALSIPSYFKGYVYIPFTKIFKSGTDTSNVSISNLRIETFRTDAASKIIIGGVYMVDNSLIPDYCSNTNTITAEVLLDGSVSTSLSNAAGNEAEKIALTTLDDFKNSIGNYTVTSGAVLSVMDKSGGVGDGKALKLDATALGSWSKAAVDIPLNTALGDAKGILVYAEWVDNTNFFIKFDGNYGSTNNTWTFAQWNANIPLYDVTQNKWIGSNESGNAGALSIPSYFKGYIYVPFTKIISSTVDTSKVTFTNMQIETFKTDACGTIIVGGVYLVENDILPDWFSSADSMTNEVLLDGVVETALTKPEFTEETPAIVLSSISDFAAENAYSLSVTDDAGAVVDETVSGTVINNIGSVGACKALSVDATEANHWRYIDVDIPVNTQIGNASGLLIYVEWVANVNFKLELTGINADGAEIKSTFKQWNGNLPLFDVINDVWVASEVSGNAGKSSFTMPYFAGYAYVPFNKLDNTDISTITNIKISTYKENEEIHSFAIGGIYLVENSLIPESISEVSVITKDVTVNGEAATLTNVLIGDVDNDGTVGGSDLIALRKGLICAEDVTIIRDVKRDGIINVIDLVRLKKILASKIG